LLSPLAIIGHRKQQIDGKEVCQVLVQWQGLLPEDTTWEDWEDLRLAYNLEDKVDFEEGSIVKDTPLADQDGPTVNDVSTRPKRNIKIPKRLEDCVRT
jgi:hypothetical protein